MEEQKQFKRNHTHSVDGDENEIEGIRELINEENLEDDDALKEIERRDSIFP